MASPSSKPSKTAAAANSIGDLFAIEELKASFAHFLGGLWVLGGVVAMAFVLQWIETLLTSKMWATAVHYAEVIDLTVLVLLFAIMGAYLVKQFIVRLFFDEKS